MTEHKQSNRIAIYVFHDPQGIVDRYVMYYLSELKKYVSRIVVVANGIVSAEGRARLEEVATDVFVRENKGFYASGYREGIAYVGWENLKQYQEVILTNDSLMGPVRSFGEMFEIMSDNQEIDFWGISKHSLIQSALWGNPYGCIPEHILASFLVFRRRFLDSAELKRFCEEIPDYAFLEEVTGKFESVFTRKFSDLCYRWTVYLNNPEDDELTDYPLMYLPRRAVEKRACPVFLRKSFYQPQDYLLNNTTGESTFELFSYLKNNTKYDTDMILENIIRTCHQSDIARTLGLIYVLPQSVRLHPGMDTSSSVALVMHLYYMDLINESALYAASMPEYADIIITTPYEENVATIKNAFSSLSNQIDIRVIENRGRDVSALLVGAADVVNRYKYVAFYHDKKTRQVNPGTVGMSFSYKLSEGLLASKCYVHNVLHTFEKNTHLGMLSPLPPDHGIYFNVLGNEWGSNYENSLLLAAEMELHVPISKDKPPVAPLGTVFWFRSAAMKALFKRSWKYEDFPPEPNGSDGTLLHAIERLYPFFAQEEGYYSAYVVSDRFASLEIGNLLHYVAGFGKVAMSHNIFGSGGNTLDVVDNMLTVAMNKTNHIGEKLRRIGKLLLPKRCYELLARIRSESIEKMKYRLDQSK